MLVLVALAACAPVAPEAAPSPTATSASPTPSPTPTPTPTPVPAVLLVSVTGLALVDTAGAVVRSVEFTDEDGTVAFLTEVLGAPPELDESHSVKGILAHRWPGATCSTGRFSRAFVVFESASVSGLVVQTVEGIHVGSSRDEVLAVGSFYAEGSYDSDADGLPEQYAIDVVPHPGSKSLSFPGEEGVDFVRLFMDGDAVTAILAPGSDWTDI